MPDDDEERRTVVVAVATDTLRRVNAWRRASTGLKFEPKCCNLRGGKQVSFCSNCALTTSRLSKYYLTECKYVEC